MAEEPFLAEQLKAGRPGGGTPQPRSYHLATGTYHSLFVAADGTVRAWGKNADGQLGWPGTTYWSTTPLTVPGLSGVIAVAAGGYTSLALTSTGTVYAWGGNTEGQLGTGDYSDEVRAPQLITGLSGVVALSANINHCPGG